MPEAVPTSKEAVSFICDARNMRVDPADREVFDREVRSFVPPGGFDAHAHLYDVRHFASDLDAGQIGDKPRVDYRAWMEWMAQAMGPRRPMCGLFFAFPTRTLDIAAANELVRTEVSKHPNSRALMLIRPGDDPTAVEREVRVHRWAGFKVYHVLADRADTFHAATGEFLPQWAWEIADRRGLAIMLHLVRPAALGDADNLGYIREHCRRYPGAKLILAHAARGFCAGHTLQSVGMLRDLDNVYFDTSAVCEPQALVEIVQTMGVTRLLYGSDFPVNAAHGRAISVGNGFWWAYENNTTQWENWAHGRLTLVGTESLIALKQACRLLRLTDSDVERIFRGNAHRLFEIIEPPTGVRGQETYQAAKAIIPGGTQLLSKRPEMFAPDRWPSYFQEARGCRVVDLDGQEYYDFSTSGIGSCALGYADADVTAAVLRRVQMGSMTTLNNPEEVELGKLLLAMHPWAQNLRLARCGGEAMAVSVRIARAATGRDRVAFCGYHGWQDWYLAANLAGDKSLDGHLLPGLSPAGVPRGLQGSAMPFTFNKLEELERLVQQHGPELAAVVMEPTRNVDPAPGFLEGVRALCDRCGAKLVFDEITVGFRLALGGAHLKYGIVPDIAVFAKALGNGHPIAAIIGQAATMQASQSTFISSTYWTEGVGPTAAIAVLKKLRQVDLPAHLEKIGRMWRDGCTELARQHQVPLKLGGHPAITAVGFDHPEAAALTTLLTVRMLKKGFLTGGGFYPTLAHQEWHVQRYLAAAEEVYAEIGEAIQKGDAVKRLGSPVKHTGFARLA